MWTGEYIFESERESCGFKNIPINVESLTNHSDQFQRIFTIQQTDQNSKKTDVADINHINVCKQVVLGICFNSDWIKWQECFSQSRSIRVQNQYLFDSKVKTTL